MDVYGFAAHGFHRLAAQKTGEHHLIDFFGKRRDGAKRQARIAAQTDGGLDFLATFLSLARVLRTDFVNLPVHAGRGFVVYLNAIHADVAPPRIRVMRKDHRQSNERPTVVGPASEYGKLS
jgi:hypothetical protein